MNQTPMYKVRKSTREDCPAIFALIKELAKFEKAEDEVEITVEQLESDGFGPNPKFSCLVAESQGEAVGAAVYYSKYSTWKGSCLYLEDLVVEKSQRRKGVGAILFSTLVKEAGNLGMKRMSWQVLQWNETAIAFYKKNNATLDDEWINCSFNEQQLKEWGK
jgi:GNAT superfamily N-acetyltransferase